MNLRTAHGCMYIYALSFDSLVRFILQKNKIYLFVFLPVSAPSKSEDEAIAKLDILFF